MSKLIDKQSIYINQSWPTFQAQIENLQPSSLFILLDENTKAHCLPVIDKNLELEYKEVLITSGEQNKNLESCQHVWNTLLKEGADRNSILINLGGGVIGDLGGYAAASFMRGMRFIQVPTTLLAQVDASIGGKTGIDYLQYKNIIGSFSKPELIWIHTEFLDTLEERELRSGFAEVIKYALIASPELWKLISDYRSLDDISNWESIVKLCVSLKCDIVLQDPFERGSRKILNFGHSLGHAIESYFLNTDAPLLHGEAIAHGMILESQIAKQFGIMRSEDLELIRTFVLRFFKELTLNPSSAKDILDLCAKDKKNKAGKKRFALVEKLGHCQYDITVTDDQILSVLNSLY